MKLYYSPLSPYVRKVRVVAHELGLDDQIELVDRPTTPLDPNDEVIDANPLGRIPALVTADQGTLMDSRVICRYLNHLAGGTLYGTEGEEFRVIAREALAEGMIDSALLAAYERRMRPEEMHFEPWVDGQLAKARRALQAFDARVDELSGPLGIDQIALGCGIGYIDFRHGTLGWREGCQKLDAWYEKFAQRPSMQATKPE
ncbi:MAG: glutathione S-transferase [Pseudomonadota bacterium]